MTKNKVAVIHSDSKIESLFTLFPLIISKYSSLFEFIHITSKRAMLVEGECVVLVRTFKGNSAFKEDNQRKRDFIKNFKKRFNRVIVLDDGAGSDSLHYEYMDLVDLYYKGKLLVDKENYLKPMYGSQYFTNYYNSKFGITDEKVKVRQPPSNPAVIDKLRVSWNLGYGMYPIPGSTSIKVAREAVSLNFSKALKPWYSYNYSRMIKELSKPVSFNTKDSVVHARFGCNSLPNTIAYQRQIFLEKCANSKKVVTGKISQKQYNNELKKVAAVLSPFGWGEICFRDFEAILSGALLIKPNMDMIDTWPNIYLASTTYIPVDWNGDNLIDTIDSINDASQQHLNMVETAREEYKKALLKVDDRVEKFIEEVSDFHIS
ncbi:hypothetical protein [uncultured Pontibacter sp.]|uniref:hypothetical protein n=1 Tax=uncultured Pontibacter sp. TaxID=453356 RepID=UPI0026084CDA|nr:hypothetical protein [uncultured Pontibacter sp.]